ncbi:serine/threonine kinase isoform X1 [Osmia lignaria lignaria]|uniref:serine/threonine kinase isoform X1 n=1 Tax=Osmia lignaria lignaria TaxID=1437193 RepID=UPI00402B9F26
MFGKVPPSNTPGPPCSCDSSSKSGPTTCLPCFSVDETSSMLTEEKSKAWRSKDSCAHVVSEPPSTGMEEKQKLWRSKENVVFEAPCILEDKSKSKNTLVEDKSRSSWRLKENSSTGLPEVSSPVEEKSKARKCKETCSATESVDDKKCWKSKESISPLETPTDDKSKPRRASKDSSNIESCCGSQTVQPNLSQSSTAFVEANSRCCSTKNSSSKYSKETSHGRNHTGLVTKSNSVVHKCSSNPNCPNFTKSPGCSGGSKSQRVLCSTSLSSLNVDPGSREACKLSKKHSGPCRELAAGKEQHLTGGKCVSREGQRNSSQAGCLASKSSSRSSDAAYSASNGKNRAVSESSDETADSSMDFSVISVIQSTPSESCSRSSAKGYGDKDTVDSSAAGGNCDRSCRGDFTTSTPSKDWMKNGDALQQNCVSCLPQDLPTELQFSPRSYREREKCRDPWRPTEMESNICNLNVCPSDTYQDTGTKRRTGASCQALRHAVASLNRLDDFYMEKIGAGFFSEVFKVTHKVTSQVMVLKMNQLPANRPNMLKEVQLMNKLSHPNILRFMGVCVHEGQLHALTEYINGGSLEQLIMARHTPLPHLIRMKLARDVSRGMAYLHSRGLFHRDLTSKNVLIKKDENTSEMTAVVGDFGLAAKIPDPSSGYRLSTVGSPYWMSPECLKGQWYDHRSDVFSFGIVVCELIGRVPADPDVLPRSDNFGLDYLAVAEICAAADPPPAFLQLAFNCCTYEPKSRPTFSEITTSLDNMISNYEDESKNNICKRQSVDPTLMSSMDEITREGRSMKRKTARLRSQSADARGCDNATPSDKARCHSARRVAELASRRDPHYRPMTANPFHALGGVKKILGDLFSSCLELPSLEDVRPSVTDAIAKFKPAQNDSIAKILDRKKPSSEPSSPTARKKWERKVATKVGAASLFTHPLFRDGWEPRRRGSCESGFWSCVGEDLSPEPPNRRHTSTLSSSAASSLFLLDDHRTSSIYTDSSEDIASLGGGDSCWEDRLGGIGSSSKTISKIVEYFERKQAGSLRFADHDVGSARLTLLKASLEGSVPLCSISAAQRLVVCEGAVRSKLPLFDKK